MRPALWLAAPCLDRVHLRHAELLLLARHLDLTLAMCEWVGSSEVLVEQAKAAHRLDPSIARLSALFEAHSPKAALHDGGLDGVIVIQGQFHELTHPGIDILEILKGSRDALSAGDCQWVIDSVDLSVSIPIPTAPLKWGGVDGGRGAGTHWLWREATEWVASEAKGCA